MHARYLDGRRFAALDGLRCLSVLAVVWHHAGGRTSGPLALGHTGVDLFFVISGFLITTLLLRERARTGSVSLRRFYARRTLRIFPLYFAVLALYALITLATRRGTGEGDAFLHHLPAFATYTSNWFVQQGGGDGTTFYFAWSLATEEQFYLFWAPVLALCLLLGRRWAAVAVMVGLVAVDQASSHAAGSGLALTVMRSIATPICLGALWALALHHPRSFAVAWRGLGHRAAAPVAALALAAAFAVVAPVEVIEVLMSVLVAACCIRGDHGLAPVLTARPLAFVGTVSYGVYLLHMLAVNAVRPVVGEQHGLRVFVAASALAIALAAASFRWFETPILRYKDQRFGAGGGPAAVRTPALRGAVSRRAAAGRAGLARVARRDSAGPA